MATPRTPRTPRTPGSSTQAAVAKSPRTPVSSGSSSSSSPSGRAKLYAKKLSAGEDLPPSASRNPDLVAWAKSQVAPAPVKSKVQAVKLSAVPASSKTAAPTAFDKEMSLASYRTQSPTRLPGAPPAKPVPGGSSKVTGYGDVPIEGASPSKAVKAPASYGSAGPEVATLQHLLKNAGYDLGPYGVDGKWGPDTQKAYEAYQKSNGAVPWDRVAAKTPQTPYKGPTSVPTAPTYQASLPKGGDYQAPSDAVSYATKYGKQYGVDPRLLLAIGKHETGWGTQGLGRRGLDLGYGAFDSGASFAWQGRENQYMYGAKWLAAHGVRTLEDLLAGKASSWATDPNWESGVASAYRGI